MKRFSNIFLYGGLLGMFLGTLGASVSGNKVAILFQMWLMFFLCCICMITTKSLVDVSRKRLEEYDDFIKRTDELVK